MLTNLGEWASARSARRAPDLDRPDFTVVTDLDNRAWTILSRGGRSPAGILGWIYRVGPDYEVTSAGDPIRVTHTATFDEGTAFLLVDDTAARTARSTIRGVG
jgi:hypothetical protein